MSRCMGASLAINLFDTLAGTPCCSMAICKSSASALNWALLMFRSMWTDFMSRTVPTPSMVLSRYLPVYLHGPPAYSQNCSCRRTFSCGMSKSAKVPLMRGSLVISATKVSVIFLMPSLPPSPW